MQEGMSQSNMSMSESFNFNHLDRSTTSRKEKKVGFLKAKFSNIVTRGVFSKQKKHNVKLVQNISTIS